LCEPETGAVISSSGSGCHQARRRFRFFHAHSAEPTSIAYGALFQRASRIGLALRERLRRGETALLIHPPSLEFIVAFFGCLLAGIVAVPIYPPKRRPDLAGLMRV
jgi:acyl-CoA synthetase (AMP-forming)/AMP-acid ligase II